MVCKVVQECTRLNSWEILVTNGTTSDANSYSTVVMILMIKVGVLSGFGFPAAPAAVGVTPRIASNTCKGKLLHHQVLHIVDVPLISK